MSDKKKHRAEFRKNRTPRPRDNDFTHQHRDDVHDDEQRRGERLSGKGDLTRKRTVIGKQNENDAAGAEVLRDVDLSVCKRGRVIGVFGLTSLVEADDGTQLQCTTRRVLKTMATDQRHIVAAGDWVYFRPNGGNEGLIERIEPRQRVLSRTSKGRQHVMVSNVDQMLIVSSAAEPYLKPNLIDRFIVSAEQNGLRPVIGINKIDLISAADLQPLIGVYARMGYRVLPLSARSGNGIELLRNLLKDVSTVIVGQSGVGKSSLLNTVQPDWNLRTSHVSTENQKGRHTTTTARLYKLSNGGYVVDTPGIRQFQLWDVIAEEVAGRFRDLRPFVNLCKFPNCTHVHEHGCGVKNGVADGFLDARRYESYCSLILDDPEEKEEWE